MVQRCGVCDNSAFHTLFPGCNCAAGVFALSGGAPSAADPGAEPHAVCDAYLSECGFDSGEAHGSDGCPGILLGHLQPGVERVLDSAHRPDGRSVGYASELSASDLLAGMDQPADSAIEAGFW